MYFEKSTAELRDNIGKKFNIRYVEADMKVSVSFLLLKFYIVNKNKKIFYISRIKLNRIGQNNFKDFCILFLGFTNTIFIS